MILTVVGLLALALLLVVLWWGWRRAGAAAVPGPRREAWRDHDGRAGARLMLDVEAPDPDHPSVQRLVRDAANRALAADPDLDHVEVVDRDGRVLADVRRPDPLPPAPALPDELREPHARSPHTPSPVPRAHVPGPSGPHELAPEVPRVPIADRLDLVPAIRSRIADADRAVDVVRAILEASGRDVAVDGDLVISEGVAIAVVDVRYDAAQALTHGFLRIEATDARRGIVLRLGYADPAEVHRREAAAPHVRHVGPDALQRMADAVAAGADPIAFAAGPATVA